MNRGSVRTEREPSTCFYGFNEAPIHESGKWPDAARSTADGDASMRPRFMNRGSFPTSSRRGARMARASMRPRFMNRGSAPKPAISEPETNKLQ